VLRAQDAQGAAAAQKGRVLRAQDAQEEQPLPRRGQRRVRRALENGRWCGIPVGVVPCTCAPLTAAAEETP